MLAFVISSVGFDVSSLFETLSVDELFSSLFDALSPISSVDVYFLFSQTTPYNEKLL